jgi:hypothetical protein
MRKNIYRERKPYRQGYAIKVHEMRKRVLPRYMTLMGRKIRVELRKDLMYEGKPAEGLFEYPNRILINPDIAESDDEQFFTLCHECGHVYCALLGLDQVLPGWLIECICQVFALFAGDIIKSLAQKK